MATEHPLPNDRSRDIGARLKAARTAKNLTQGQVADELGRSKALISQFEYGRTYPSLPILIKICELYGVSIDVILTGRSRTERVLAELQSVMSRLLSESESLRVSPPIPGDQEPGSLRSDS